MRWIPFFLWVSGTIVLVLAIVSDFAFGDGNAKLLAKRLGLAIVWPLAALSKPGREILFNYGSKL